MTILSKLSISSRFGQNGHLDIAKNRFVYCVGYHPIPPFIFVPFLKQPGANMLRPLVIS